MGRRPKTYTFHSRKARFTVYCASTNQQQALLQHLLTVESADSLRCAIVAPVISSSGQQRASTSASRKSNSLLVPELYPLAKLGRKRARKDDSDSDDDENATSIALGSEDSSGDENDSDSDSDNDNDSDSDNNSEYVDEDEQPSENEGDQRSPCRSTRKRRAAEDAAIDQDESSQDDDDEWKRIDLYAYRVFLEYYTAPARSSKAWGAALFEGFDKSQKLESLTPLPTSKFDDEQDNYIVDLLMSPAAAQHGTPTLDEHATLRLVTERYSDRANQDQVIKDIGQYCRGRAVAPSTLERIKKHWRQANNIPITPRVLQVQDAVMPRLIREHPFFPHKVLDGWVQRFVGPGKSLNRLHYKPLVLWSRLGRLGKTDWARSLGRYIHIRGSLDAEKIHSGIQQGADVLILDNVKWHMLFGSDLGRALAESQEDVSWIRKGGEKVTTRITVPVIIINNRKCKTWGTHNSKAYWKKHLLWVKVRKIMFDEGILNNTEDASAGLSSYPPASSSSSASSSLCSSPPSSSPVLISVSPSSAPSSLLALSSLATPPPKSARQELPTLHVNSSKITRYGPDSYLITDWLSREDADRQVAAWELLAEEFVLMKHRGNPLARWKAFYCDVVAGSRTMYEYTSSELEAWEQHEWSSVGLQLRDAVRTTLREDVNSLVANDYQHRKHQIGWHYDKRPDIAHGTAIATVSLGHPRQFQLCLISELQRHRADEKARKVQMETNKQQGIKQKVPPIAPLAGVIDVVLPHGSLFVIGPKTNALYEHRIPPSEEECGKRYGLTFRTIASRWLPDAEVVILQPPQGKTEWDVMHRPKEVRKNGPIGQNGYAYRSRIFLEAYTPADPTRLTEADITAVRTSMPRPKLRGKPSRLDDEVQSEGGDEEEVEAATEAEVDAGPGTAVITSRGRRKRAAAAEPAEVPAAPRRVVKRRG